LSFLVLTQLYPFSSNFSLNALYTDKPARPLGPLKAEEVRANHIKVKWQKPPDNGGSEITGYVLEKMDMDTGRWVPAGECGPDKDTFTVDGLTPKKKYKIRVKAVNKEGESEPLEMDEAIMARNPYGTNTNATAARTNIATELQSTVLIHQQYAIKSNKLLIDFILTCVLTCTSISTIVKNFVPQNFKNYNQALKIFYFFIIIKHIL
jgi:Fibronectin type III domain